MGAAEPLPPAISMNAFPSSLVRHLDHVTPESQSCTTRAPFQDSWISTERRSFCSLSSPPEIPLVVPAQAGSANTTIVFVHSDFFRPHSEVSQLTLLVFSKMLGGRDGRGGSEGEGSPEHSPLEGGKPRDTAGAILEHRSLLPRCATCAISADSRGAALAQPHSAAVATDLNPSSPFAHRYFFRFGLVFRADLPWSSRLVPHRPAVREAAGSNPGQDMGCQFKLGYKLVCKTPPPKPSSIKPGETTHLWDFRFAPLLHSVTAPYSPHFTIMGSQDLDIKIRPNLWRCFTLNHCATMRCWRRQRAYAALAGTQVRFTQFLRHPLRSRSNVSSASVTLPSFPSADRRVPAALHDVELRSCADEMLFILPAYEIVIAKFSFEPFKTSVSNGFYSFNMFYCAIRLSDCIHNLFALPLTFIVEWNGNIWAASNVGVVRADEDEVRWGWEQRRNAKAGETGDPRENPPTSGIVRHDSHLRKSAVERGGDFKNPPGEGFWVFPGICRFPSFKWGIVPRERCPSGLFSGSPGGNGMESAMAFVRDPSQHLPGVISGNHGRPKSGWLDRGLSPCPPECESSELPVRHFARPTSKTTNFRRNEGAEETGDPRENPLTNIIFRHDSHLRKTGDTAGD
ncbi:hypothetical protein PR048_007206 [Dryococelus australis]|uniref:Uncharacterized protein n=1 Tax=Dryococelus australis TaxID=614101 RepID=A0ABQ9IE80_9NEOP|nr:hypothetical protein PR048_007206 [Dryococelus australis]